jgi:L-ascorbate metabolism protein UlaG (beta-lactamase superfamily)
LIEPLLKDEAFLADVRLAAAAAPSAIHVWWLGQSGFLVRWNNRHLLFDPYLSDSLTAKYAGTDKPHVRMTSRVVAPERLDFVDVVTSSHNHTDHLDAETLLPLFAANPRLRLVLPEGNRSFAARRLGRDGVDFVGLAEGESREVAGFVVTAVPAAHEERSPEYAGFIVRAGQWTVYHSGDTIAFPQLEEALRPRAIDLAFLPINGRAPERRVAGNLDGREAAELARAVGARLVVPCHFEMFTFNTAEPGLFVETCRRLSQPFRVLRAGERLTLEHPAAQDASPGLGATFPPPAPAPANSP